MKLGKVIGTVVSTQKVESFEGVKLLLLQPLDEQGSPEGNPIAACDMAQAGVGDTVIYEGGREAALALQEWFNPTDATIMGIVDNTFVDKTTDETADKTRDTMFDYNDHAERDRD